MLLKRRRLAEPGTSSSSCSSRNLGQAEALKAAQGLPYRVALACLLPMLAGGCAKALTAKECDTLLEHYTDLLLEAHRPEATPEERMRARTSARLKAQGDPAFARCESRVDRKTFECAMAATDPDKLEQCMLF